MPAPGFPISSRSRGAPHRPGALLRAAPVENGEVLLGGLQGAAFPAMGRVAEILAVAWDVPPVAALVESGANEPAVGASRVLIDATDPAATDGPGGASGTGGAGRAASGTFHGMLGW